MLHQLRRKVCPLDLPTKAVAQAVAREGIQRIVAPHTVAGSSFFYLSLHDRKGILLRTLV